MATTNLDYRNPTIIQVDDSQVTIENGVVTVNMTAGADGALLAANNLSDLDDPDTALTNLGADTVGAGVFKASSANAARVALGATSTGSALFTAADESAARTTLDVNRVSLTATCYVAATTAGVTHIAVPTNWTGRVALITGVNSANPGGTVAFTCSIGTSGGSYTAITGGTFNVTNGAAAGTASIGTPSAANNVVGGTSIIRIAWDNGAASAVNVGVTVEITRS